MQVCHQVINAGEPLKMMQIGCLNHFSLLKPKEVKYMTFNHNLIVLSLLAVVSSASAQSLDSKNFGYPDLAVFEGSQPPGFQ